MELKDLLKEVGLLREDILKTRLQLKLKAMESREQMDCITYRLELLQLRRDCKMRELTEAILKMKNTDTAMIMTLRYLENRDWSYIEEQVYLSRSQIFRLHRQGLTELAQRLEKPNPL